MARAPLLRGRRCGAACAVILLSCGCIQEMANQPKVEVYEANRFFEDGMGARPPVPGTIARGQLPGDRVLASGSRDGQPIEEIPVEVTQELLDRGQQRFGIYCAHCHGPAGYGDGMVVQRGFPSPPSYHIERLREAPAGHLFGVIAGGLGRMPAFRNRIPPEDRWAIVAYVRALQLSQHTEVSTLSEEARAQLSPEGAEQP